LCAAIAALLVVVLQCTAHAAGFLQFYVSLSSNLLLVFFLRPTLLPSALSIFRSANKKNDTSYKRSEDSTLLAPIATLLLADIASVLHVTLDSHFVAAARELCFFTVGVIACCATLDKSLRSAMESGMSVQQAPVSSPVPSLPPSQQKEFWTTTVFDIHARAE